MPRHSLLLVVVTLLATTATCDPQRRLRKKADVKYLRCNSDQYGCGHDRVSVCHFNGKSHTTLCLRAKSDIVELLHESDQCGVCPVAVSRALETKAELQQAIDRYIAGKGTYNAELANSYGWPMNSWDVSRITDFSKLFAQQRDFHEDISQWQTSQVTDMSEMFWHAHSFAGDLSQWDVSSVTSFDRMFFGAQYFNSDLTHWDTSSARNMMGMFWKATMFNPGDLSHWDVSRVVVMSRMFSDCIYFEGKGLSDWDVSQLRDSSYMFLNAQDLDVDLGGWNVQNLGNAERMFYKVASMEHEAEQERLMQTWKERLSFPIDLEGMFSPSDVSARTQAQQVSSTMGLDKLLQLTGLANPTNVTAPDDATANNAEDGERYSATRQDMLCPGGLCMQ